MPDAEKIRITCTNCGRGGGVRLQYLGKRVKCPACGLTFEVARLDVAPAALAAMPASVAREHAALPLEADGGVVTVAVADASDLDLVDRLAFILNRRVRLLEVPAAIIRAEIERHYGPESDPNVDDLYREFSAGAPSDPAEEMARVLTAMKAGDLPRLTLTEALDRAADLRKGLTPAALAELRERVGADAVAVFDRVVEVERVFDCDPVKDSVSERGAAITRFLAVSGGPAPEGKLSADDTELIFKRILEKVGIGRGYTEYTKAVLVTIKGNRDACAVCEWFIGYVALLCKLSGIGLTVLGSAENLLAHMHLLHGLAARGGVQVGARKEAEIAASLDRLVEDARLALPTGEGS